MSITNLQELFRHDLEDMYYVENELLDALDELADQSDQEELSTAFQEHREETEGHVDRLERVFDMLGTEPDEEECEGIEGLLSEHEDFMEEDPDQEVINVHNLVAAQKTEHYEIAAYGNLVVLADRLGMEEAGDLLEENLQEEQQALDDLVTLTENFDYDRVTETTAAD